MRLAILADIHGNYQALQAVLADIALVGVDKVVSLGDNIGYGPEPEEVVQALIRYRVVSVMGNHELALVSRRYNARLHATASESLAITRSLLSPASLVWLEHLPAVCLCNGARFVHGCPPQSITTYLQAPSENRLRRVFASYPDRICFAGHTHDVALHRQAGNVVASCTLEFEPFSLDPYTRYLILPGSVGQPRDTLNWYAKYLVWDQDAATIEVRNLSYDVQSTIRLLSERGFPPSNAMRLFW